MCVTHGMPCVNMHDTFESYKYGSSNSVRGEQQEEGEGREKRKGGKENRKGGKERRKGGKEKKRKEEKIR